MTALLRDPEKAASTRFDVIIVGGGIQGACLLLEAARRGIRALLIERGDFGGGTSWNSLRIAHGGLRHLQHGRLADAYTSGAEQHWWFRNFPDLVEPLACVLPLYNRGLRRCPFLRAALRTHRSLVSWSRRERWGERSLPAGRMLSIAETRARFPAVDTEGLRGAALWYDGRFTQPQRLQVEILRWAVAAGAQVLNYMECEDLLVEDREVVGVSARCREEQRSHRFVGSVVVNTASARAVGPLGAAARALAPHGSARAFNVVLARPSLSECALAVSPPRRGAPSYFAVPQSGRMVVGTVHLPEAPGVPASGVGRREVEAFLADLNLALPGLRASMDDVVEVHAGRLPAAVAGSAEPAARARIFDHREKGGPRGLLSVENVKFTDARWVAERVLRTLFRTHWRTPLWSDQGVRRPEPIGRPNPTLGAEAVVDVSSWMSDESALHIDDLLLRRLDCDRDPNRLQSCAEQLIRVLPWDGARRREERDRLERALRVLGAPQDADPRIGEDAEATASARSSDPVLETPDLESSTDAYAQRFTGGVGAYFLSTQLDAVSRNLPPAPGCRVLDIGGGHAQLAAPLVERGYEVTVRGSDPRCRERLDRCVGEDRYSFSCGSLSELPFEDDHFDVVLAVRMLAHLDDWRGLIQEACRVSKGIVILDFPERRSANWFADPFFGLKRAVERDTRRFASFRGAEVSAAFASSGFEVRDRYPQFLFPMALHRFMRSPRLTRVIEKVARRLGATQRLGSPVIATATECEDTTRSSR